MKDRLIAVALVAAAITAWLLSLTVLPWFHATLGNIELSVAWHKVRDQPGLDVVANPYVMIVGVLATLYFFARLFFLGLLVVIDGPTRTRTIAWYTPVRAHVQGLIVLGVAIAMVVLVPTLELKGSGGTLPAELHRSAGGFVLLASLVLAQIAIHRVARNPDLAETQAWQARVPTEPARPPVPRERPLVKPPLSAAPVDVDASPFRQPAPPPPARPIKVVETVRAPRPAPRADTDAPGPRLLT